MKAKKILKAIELMTESELVQLNNAYCQNINSDNEVYENDEEFFNVFFENKILEAVRAISYGEYHYTHDWVRFNGCGNLETINYFGISELCELPQIIAEYIEENFNDFKFLFN